MIVSYYCRQFEDTKGMEISKKSLKSVLVSEKIDEVNDYITWKKNRILLIVYKRNCNFSRKVSTAVTNNSPFSISLKSSQMDLAPPPPPPPLLLQDSSFIHKYLLFPRTFVTCTQATMHHIGYSSPW